MRRVRHWVAASVIGLGVAFSAFAPSASAEIRQVDGKLWTASSADQKRAYLAGVANTLATVKALAVKAGNPYANPAVDRLDAGIDTGTIDTAMEKVDAWYAANPSRLDAPVIGVLWLALVKR